MNGQKRFFLWKKPRGEHETSSPQRTGWNMIRTPYKSNLSNDEKVLMAIVRAAEIFKRVHSVVFRTYGLSFPQYNLLRVLDASAKGRNKISEVGRMMLVPAPNMTGIAKRLIRGGFIMKKSDPHDDRVTLLQITPKVKKTLSNFFVDIPR